MEQALDSKFENLYGRVRATLYIVNRSILFTVIEKKRKEKKRKEKKRKNIYIKRKEKKRKEK